MKWKTVIQYVLLHRSCHSLMHLIQWRSGQQFMNDVRYYQDMILGGIASHFDELLRFKLADEPNTPFFVLCLMQCLGVDWFFVILCCVSTWGHESQYASWKCVHFALKCGLKTDKCVDRQFYITHSQFQRWCIPYKVNSKTQLVMMRMNFKRSWKDKGKRLEENARPLQLFLLTCVQLVICSDQHWKTNELHRHGATFWPY